MEKKMKNLVIILVIILLSACAADEPLSEEGGSNGDKGAVSTATYTEVTAGIESDGDVKTFTITLDDRAFDESVNVDPDDEDFVENTTFAETVHITFNTTGSAVVEGDTDGSVTVNGNDVIVNYTGDAIRQYILSGTTTDGYFKLYSSRKQAIKLNGVHITNPDGAAINNQSKKRTFVVLSDDSDNTLTDGATYTDVTDDEDMKACLFSEGQLVFSGTGRLEVDANCKAGIRSDDYVRFMPGCHVMVDASSGNGIRGNDAVIITGGVINVNVAGVADKGISTDGTLTVDGGRTTVITSGGCVFDSDENDYSASAGIKADGDITINGGWLNLYSTGTGGKGISTDASLSMNGGMVNVITTGKKQTFGGSSASPKGIKADGVIAVTGGHIKVRAIGGEGSEGIESKDAMTVSGGVIEGWCYDDVLNSKGDLSIDGGAVYAHSTGNDAIDSNRNLYLNGGVVVAEGASGAECGIDAAEGYKAYMNGGTVVALGGNLQAIESTSKQASACSTVSSGIRVGLLMESTAILGYNVPAGNATALMISSPALQSGSTYTLRSGCSFTGGSSFYSLATGCAIGSATSSTDVTAAIAVSGSMGGHGGGPGGRPW